MVTPVVVEVDEGTLTLSVTCVSCDKAIEFQVPADGYEKRLNGELIQRCFPALSNDLRELMVSGICPKCWNKMFNIREMIR
jgi:hypothetical protein